MISAVRQTEKMKISPGQSIFLFFAIFACFGYATQADKLLTINIKSEGCDDSGITGCGHATIRINGKDHSLRRRGYNIVVVNGDTGAVESRKVFDTYGDSTAHHGMIWHLNQIAKRKLVLVAIQDAASAKMSDKAYDALTKFGATNLLKFRTRSSFALLGWSGYGKLDAVTQVQRDRYKGPSIISKVINLPL